MIALAAISGLFGAAVIAAAILVHIRRVGIARCRHCGAGIPLGADGNWGSRTCRRRDHEKVCIS